MPRINPALLRRAKAIDSLVASLLPVCRDLGSACNELRWLREHVAEALPDANLNEQQAVLRQLAARRRQGEPLQYLLGSEYFGDLQLRCKAGVLIPRQETAAAVTHLVDRVQEHFFHRSNAQSPSALRLLDLCTGTGCIPLLFQHEFHQSKLISDVELDCVGVDISMQALRLAEENRAIQLVDSLDKDDQHRASTLKRMKLIRADLFASGHKDIARMVPSLENALSGSSRFDVLISNPPYVSRQQYNTITARSVRKFEPELALVPRHDRSAEVEDGDQFYPRLWQIAEQVQAKMVLFEVGDMAQAIRVVNTAHIRQLWDHIEIWRDEPTASNEPEHCLNAAIKIIGKGHGRSVFAWRDL